MRRLLIGIGVTAVVFGGCARNVTAPTQAILAHGVLIRVAVPGPCLVGGCDPLADGRTHLGLVSVVNTGSATAYLSACGTQAALTEQQYVDGAWVFVGPAYTCPNTPGPIALSPGDSLRVNWFFATGLRRIVLGAAGAIDLSDEVLGASAPFSVP